MRFPVPIRERRTFSTRACQLGSVARTYSCGCALSRLFRAALFGERDFNVFVREDGANFDVSAQGADVVTQCSKFDFGAFFETRNFALLHLHGKRNFSLTGNNYFSREDVLTLKHAFDRAAVPTCVYSSPGELIALRHGLKNYLGRDAGLPAVVRAVIDGTLVPVAYTNRFPGILGYLFRSEDLRNYRPTQTPMPPGGFLNYREAARMLETRTEVICGLIFHGILSSPNEYRPGLAKLVPARDVQFFAACYVDAFVLAQRSGSSNRQMIRGLRESKVSTLDVPIPGKGPKIFVPRNIAATMQPHAGCADRSCSLDIEQERA